MAPKRTPPTAIGRPFPGTTKHTGTRTIKITTNKIPNPADQLLDKNFVFENFAVTIRQQHPKRLDVFAFSAECVTFAATY